MLAVSGIWAEHYGAENIRESYSDKREVWEALVY